MMNEKGGIKLSTLIGILLVLVLILFTMVVYVKVRDKKSGTEPVETNTAQVNNTTVQTPVTPTESTTDEFSTSFLKMENNNQNMIYSPLSIKYALKMLQEGANGNTYDQINKVIGNLNLTTYKNVENKLSLANSVFIRDTYSQYVRPEYTDLLVNKYNAELKIDKFENATNANNWIEDKTLGLIKNMLKDNQVAKPNVEMLLINALAIDLEWKDSFGFGDTSGQEFYLDNGEEMVATMMHQKTSSDSTSYYISENETALSMDLEEQEGQKLEFVAIMPKQDLKEYVKNLDKQQIDNVLSNMKSASSTKAGVKISIPKFKFDYDLNLKQDLINLGITDVFEEVSADFSKMAKLEETGRNLYVDDALHKATIDFSEKGIKAAAVTVMMMMEATAIQEPTEPIEIKIDRPFAFIIKDKNTGEIWFVGTVNEPNSWENDKREYTEKNNLWGF